MRSASYAWLAPEVVQASAMDCGPASLKCLLEGFGISASYGRLREACQTDIDGTSIDTLEDLAVEMGLDAEQIMVPAEHVLEPASVSLPAIVVVQKPWGHTHFLVIWRCHLGFVQVMDPSTGRRWLWRRQLTKELYTHTMAVPAKDWRDWAGTTGFLTPLDGCLRSLGVTTAQRGTWLGEAAAHPSWRCLGALDAAARMAGALVRSGGMRSGAQAAALLHSYWQQSRRCAEADSPIPTQFWSVRETSASDAGDPQLLVTGAVLVTVHGRRAVARDSTAREAGPKREVLARDVVAALREPDERPLRDVWRLLGQDGWCAPLSLGFGVLAAGFAVVLEALLFRALIDLPRFLGQPEQRLGAVLGLLGFLALALVLAWPQSSIALRMGRHLEVRLRLAFLKKLPRLGDRYFSSRLTSDMADRAHHVHALRQAPQVGADLVGSFAGLTFTTAGLAWLDPGLTWLALSAAGMTLALPVMFQGWLAERDLLIRTHAGALTRFHLDSLLGLAAVHSHGAQPAIRREHESLLVRWVRASYGLLGTSVLIEVFLSLTGLGFAVLLLTSHLQRVDDTRHVLLLVYWALSVPNLAGRFWEAVFRYPSLRSIALRMMEPLGAPEHTGASEGRQTNAERPGGPRRAAAQVTMRNVVARAGGHTVLRDVSLDIAAGSHVAIVGPSGAGKTSLVGMLLGWSEPSTGEVLVDGRVLAGGHLAETRRRTAWVDPSVQLWNETFLENIRYGYCDADDQADGLDRVMETTKLHRVVQALPDGYQTVLGEGGGLLSGGEGHLLRLGRALLHPDPRLVILDEPFRGLDREARRLLLKNVRRAWGRTTLLYVTHDLADAASFDRVLCVQRGEIVEDGVPERLLGKKEGVFAAMLAAQRRVEREVWQHPQWRRLTIEDGRLKETQDNDDAC